MGLSATYCEKINFITQYVSQYLFDNLLIATRRCHADVAEDTGSQDSNL